MYTKKTFPIKGLIRWTRRDIYKFLIIGAVPVFLYTVVGMKFLHLPWTPIAVLGTAVAFIIGFKNNASYDRLWEARKIWGGIVNASRSWGIMVRDFIGNEHAKDKLSEADLRSHQLKIVRRHIAWMAAHRYGLRTKKPWEAAFENKSNKEYADRHPVPESKMPLEEALSEYLEADELAHVMSKKNKATALIALQSKHLKELKDKKYIWEFSYLEMENMLVEFYTLQGKNERIKNFPYPRQFATLNVVFIWIFILLLPFGVLSSFEEMSDHLLEHAGDVQEGIFQWCYQLVAKYFVWLAVPFCTIISWVFNTIERVGEVSENPFEGTANDIPITTMSRGIEIDMLEIFDVENTPAPIEAKFDIQM